MMDKPKKHMSKIRERLKASGDKNRRAELPEQMKKAAGLSPIDLAVIESETWDLVKICELYGVPPEIIKPEQTYPKEPDTQ